MPTPSWQVAVADDTQVRSSDFVNQLLGAHGVIPVYEGSQIGQVTGALSTVQPLAGVQVAQPFVQPVGKTEIDRVELPLQLVGAAGGADVVVSLQTDSAGSPSGTVLGSVTVPNVFLAGLVPGPLTGMATASTMPYEGTNPTTGYLPGNLPSGSQAKTQYAMAQQGGLFVAVAGGATGSHTGPFTPQVFTAPLLGDDVGAWMRGPDLPNTSGVGEGALAYDPASGTLVFSGGYNGSFLSAVYAAAWDADGTVGAWNDQPALPLALYGHGSVSDGQGHVYVVGGFDSSSAGQTATYMSTISGGQLSAWTQVGTALPVGAGYLATGVVNGWLVAAGGQDVGPTIRNQASMAKINPDGTLQPWRPLPTLPGGSFPMASWAALGDVFVAHNNVNPHTMTIAPNGDHSRAWRPAPQFTLATGSRGVAWPATSTPRWNVAWLGGSSQNADKSQLAPQPTLTVPLHVTGLTPGVTYHLVVASPSADANHTAGVALTVSSVPSTPARIKVGAGSWTAQPSGTAIPILLFADDQTGPLLHLLEDLSGGVPARWAWLAANHLAGRPLQLVGEATSRSGGLAATLALLGYDPSGLVLTSTVMQG